MNISRHDELVQSIRDKWMFSELADEQFMQLKIEQENFQIDNLRRVCYSIDRPVTELRLLDIGCGEGGFAVAAHNAGFVAYGVDINARNIDICRLRGFKYNFDGDRFLLTEPGERLPFPDHSFDVVTLFEVLEHVSPSQLGGLLEEVRRILVPSGFAYIEVPNALWPLEGHVDKHFIHWIPRAVRGIVLRMVFDSSLMRHNNYLEEINYHSSRGWCRFISRYFAKTVSPDALLLDFALGTPYQHGGYKTLKYAAKQFIHKLPLNVITTLYRNFGPLAVFVVRP